MKNRDRIRVVELLKSEPRGSVVVKGWVRTKRGNKNIAFVALNDGSTINNIQIVFERSQFSEETLAKVTTGAAIAVRGKLVSSIGGGQSVEIQAEELKIYGTASPESYPLQKKGHTMEFLREIAHLRPRTNTFGAIFRIRHSMAYAIHKFFNDKGYYYLHTPILTASDAEGAGAMFQVTTLDIENPPKDKEGRVDWSQDFFGREASLTVSGQLEGELGAMALGGIYTFGPTFRAENSNTPRHLSEFWMIEPEVAFMDIVENMDLAEEFIKYLVQYALDNNLEDLTFLNNMFDKGLLERLRAVTTTTFERITYTEGVEILIKSGVEFEFPIYWGVDLQSEHERYLVERHFKKPVIVTDYPKEIKAFYMKLNSDNKTVRAMDLLFPKIGEIIGGSEREENWEKLNERIEEMEMDMSTLWWYLESREYGTAPHSGFGLGFERLLLFVTGMSNIRDVIPFPRSPKHIEF